LVFPFRRDGSGWLDVSANRPCCLSRCSRIVGTYVSTFIQGLFCAFGILHIVDPDKAIAVA
jgi:hypothetical protein